MLLFYDTGVQFYDSKNVEKRLLGDFVKRLRQIAGTDCQDLGHSPSGMFHYHSSLCLYFLLTPFHFFLTTYIPMLLFKAFVHAGTE